MSIRGVSKVTKRGEVLDDDSENTRRRLQAGSDEHVTLVQSASLEGLLEAEGEHDKTRVVDKASEVWFSDVLM